MENYNHKVNRVFSSYLTTSAAYMEKLYGEDNKLPLSNISFNSSSRDYKMPKSGESLPAYFTDILRMQLILINYLSTCFFICLFLSLFFLDFIYLYEKFQHWLSFCEIPYPRNSQLIAFQHFGFQTFRNGFMLAIKMFSFLLLFYFIWSFHLCFLKHMSRLLWLST